MIRSEIIDKDGYIISWVDANAKVPSHGKSVLKYSSEVLSPHLWDIDDTYLYEIKTTLWRDEKFVTFILHEPASDILSVISKKALFLMAGH